MSADVVVRPNRGPGPGVVARVAARASAGGAVVQVVVPVLAVVAALVVGGVLIAFDGSNPLSVYREIVSAVLTGNRGYSDTATAATPLILIGLGYAVAYRARVFTIGGEGQYLIGALAGTAWVTGAGLRDLPRWPLMITGLIVACLAGAAWSGLAGWLGVRFGANIVISSLMLVYIADSALAWAVRDGIKDPESFVNQSRQVGRATLPELWGTKTHIGFAIAVALVPVAAVLLARHRGGFRITASGHNPSALDANEVSNRTVILLVMVIAGSLAGLAGMVETAGVNGRLGAQASVGFGFQAIIVALLGRLSPVGVGVAGLGLAGLTIGFESAQREFDLPSSLVGVITALIVVFVVVGDALAHRGRGGR
jgi:general nucleoside transport system permease protein